MLRRTILRLLGAVPVADLLAARAEAELLRVQLELTEAALVIARMQAGRWSGPLRVMRVVADGEAN